jgi:branched-chain amino acid transport system substrate-binding protein
VTLRARALAILAATTAVASACTGGSVVDPPSGPSADPVPVKVAFFQDGSIESPNTHAQPAFLGLKLAFSQAIEGGNLPVLPELVGLDTEGDAEVAADLAAQVAADPSYVAAVAAPYWLDTSQVASLLEAAGIPVLSLSGASPRGDRSWFRLVAGGRQQITALAGYVRGRRGAGGVCVAGDGSRYAREMGDRLEIELRGAVFATVTVATGSGDSLVAAGTIAESGCSTVIWTGYGTGAGELRTALAAHGVGNRLLVGVDAMKDPAYLDVAGASAEGTVVVCACVDLTTSTDVAAQRFVHDFQADYAIPPGVYAAEGWDAGGVLLRAFRARASTPEAVEGSLRDLGPFGGLAGTYQLGEGASAPVHLFRALSGRWVPLGADQDSLPLRTQGVLAVGSCRVGSPFAYRDARGRLVGFDVEFARAIARRLDLALGWTRISCRAGSDPVDGGLVDVLLVPSTRLVPGTPSSRVFFSTRASLVVRAHEVGDGGRAPKPGVGDVVGVVAGAPIADWARRTLVPDGAQLRTFRHDARRAYALLERGQLWAVADTEAGGWAAIEHRPELLVGTTDDTGTDDVMVAAASEAAILVAVDDALGRLLRDGTYAMLFAKYFPGATLPDAVGT